MIINTVKAVADALNLTSFKAGCLPVDKLNEIKRLQGEGKIVAMAGDGSMMHRLWHKPMLESQWEQETDVAIQSAEITLVKGDLKVL